MSKNNVIDLSERIQKPDPSARFKNLKVRFDLEHGKLLVSTSLLSIVLLVTLANNSLLGGGISQQKVEYRPSRGIASIPTGTSDAEDSLVARLASKELSEEASVGRRPSALEKLTLGFLEGKYAVQLQNGKLSQLHFTEASAAGDLPKRVENLNAFLESNRDLLPVAFSKSVKVESAQQGENKSETFQLVNQLSMPVAKVQFLMDSAGRLLSMRVAEAEFVSK